MGIENQTNKNIARRSRLGPYVITGRTQAQTYEEEGGGSYQIVDYAHAIESERWRLQSSRLDRLKLGLSLLSGTLLGRDTLSVTQTYRADNLLVTTEGHVSMGAFFQLTPSEATKAVELIDRNYQAVVSVVFGVGYVLQVDPNNNLMYRILMQTSKFWAGDKAIIPTGATYCLITPPDSSVSVTTFRMQDVLRPFAPNLERPLSYLEEGKVITHPAELEGEEVTLVDRLNRDAIQKFWAVRNYLRETPYEQVLQRLRIQGWDPRGWIRISLVESRG